MQIRHEVLKAATPSVGLLAFGSFEEDKDPLFNVSILSTSERTRVKNEISKFKFEAKAGEALPIPIPSLRLANFVFLIGLGKREKFTLEKARRAAARALAQAKALRIKKIAFDLNSFEGRFGTEDALAAIVEGLRLASYEFAKYKSKPSPKAIVEDVALFTKDSSRAKLLEARLKQSETIAGGVCFTRDLANEPANILTPSRLAQFAKEMAAKNRLSCKILGRKEIKALKMGGVLAVSQGSAEEPKFIVLENKVNRPLFSNPLVFVGKGVTFDTGGISIKPSSDMDKMKFDMCGAAAVIGAMKVIANLKLPIRVVGLAPLVENMPGSTAQRPGDIITCLNGKTVEVLNTDAEGRLILADALSYAARYKPKALVDLATLTGACAVTFHDLAIGLMGTDAELVERVKKAGEKSGERCWELPLWDEYAELIKATFADIQNISKKYAGTITAGMFLKEFADHTKSWAHLDIAGTAWNDGGAKPLSPIGATGVGVRLLVELVKSYL